MQIRKTLLTFPIYLVSVFLQEKLKALEIYDSYLYHKYMNFLWNRNVEIFMTRLDQY